MKLGVFAVLSKGTAKSLNPDGKRVCLTERSVPDVCRDVIDLSESQDEVDNGVYLIARYR